MFQIIASKLKDENPEVRIAAIECAFNAIVTCFLLIPEEYKTRVMKMCTTTLANDASSYKVCFCEHQYRQ